MSERHPDDPSDDFAAEISDLRAGRATEPQGSPSPAEPPLVPVLRPGQRVARIGRILGAVAIALLLVLSTFPSVRGGAVALFAGPTPAPTVAPSSSAFYLLPSVPGGTVTLDGQRLKATHTIESGQPLRLTPGRHTLTWRAAPFQPLNCVISLPHLSTDTCPLSTRTTPTARTWPGVILTMHQTLDALPFAQAQALRAALQNALDANEATAPVLRGEHYFSATPGVFGSSLAATEPLRATLQFALLTGDEPPEPCLVAPDVQPCRFYGQDCIQLCTLPPQDILTVRPTGEWDVAALVRASWTYTTFSGSVVANTVDELNLGFALAMFGVRWNGSQWSAQPIFGHASGIEIADDTMCLPARGWLFQGPLAFIFQPQNGAAVEARYMADGVPTDGCVAEIVDHNAVPGQAASVTNPALFLARFGVLVAANDAALALWPDLPLADATEQALAQRLARG
jgi:hypothetical protein